MIGCRPAMRYWTILVDDQPTAFRAHEPEELLPTLNRLKEKHASAVMKWFERGQLWESRDAAREAGEAGGERRDRTWRPGGEHRDPRQPYKDAKKAKWQRFKQGIRARWEEKQARPEEPVDPESFTPPHGDPLRPEIDKPPSRPRARDNDRDNPPRGGFDKPRGPRRDDGDRRDRDDRPRSEPRGDERRERSEWRPKGPPRGDRRAARQRARGPRRRAQRLARSPTTRARRPQAVRRQAPVGRSALR